MLPFEKTAQKAIQTLGKKLNDELRVGLYDCIQVKGGVAHVSNGYILFGWSVTVADGTYALDGRKVPDVSHPNFAAVIDAARDDGEAFADIVEPPMAARKGAGLWLVRSGDALLWAAPGRYGASPPPEAKIAAFDPRYIALAIDFVCGTPTLRLNKNDPALSPARMTGMEGRFAIVMPMRM